MFKVINILAKKFDITEAGKTFSFNIKINEDDITEDGWYPTNADFELTYTDPKGTTKTIKSTKNLRYIGLQKDMITKLNTTMMDKLIIL